jgi:hypothetical protein
VEVTLLLAAGGLLAGVFGALLGLGGGILIVPLLTLGFGVPFREAVAVSLLAVITTSSAGAAVYLRQRLANLRLGLTLELATALGALVGGLVAFTVSDRLLAGAFAILLVYTATSMLRSRSTDRAPGLDELPAGASETVLQAADDTDAWVGYAATLGGSGYGVRRLPLGLVLSWFAGIVSALLGVGGGTVKVPAMHLVMGVPLRVATATSNLMIGVTASASALLYLARGAVDPLLAGPVVVGVFVGAAGASRAAGRVPVGVLRLLFVLVLGYVALEMAARALGISLLGPAR